MTQGSLAPAESPALSPGPLSGPQPANLGDILERVLDKGIVIAGDIRVNLLEVASGIRCKRDGRGSSSW